MDSLCGPPVVIIADSLDYDYLWSTGDSAYYTSVNSSGVYQLEVTNVCGSFTDSAEVTFFADILVIPSLITPDGDGIDDVFNIPHQYSDLFIDLKIYDLMGTLIFQTNDINAGWDGSFNGTPQPAGPYLYSLTISCGIITTIKTGRIVLIR